MIGARQIANIFDDSDNDDDPVAVNTDHAPVDNRVNHVSVRQSPYMNIFHGHQVVRITVDSGDTGNMIRSSTATRLVTISKSSQSAHQADGSSPLHTVGETRLSLTRDGKSFTFEWLVVENLDVEVLAGTPFMERNDITVLPATH
jgi:hypothetical protein